MGSTSDGVWAWSFVLDVGFFDRIVQNSWQRDMYVLGEWEHWTGLLEDCLEKHRGARCANSTVIPSECSHCLNFFGDTFYRWKIDLQLRTLSQGDDQ